MPGSHQTHQCNLKGGHKSEKKDQFVKKFVQGNVQKLKGSTLNEIINFINNPANATQFTYLFLIRVSDRAILANGRTPIPISAPQLRQNQEPFRKKLVDRIVRCTKDHSTAFVEYVFQDSPNQPFFIKRSYVKRVKIGHEEYIIGAGYP